MSDKKGDGAQNPTKTRSKEDLLKIKNAKDASIKSEFGQNTLILKGERREFFRFALGKLVEYDTIGRGAGQISLLPEELSAIEETGRPARFRRDNLSVKRKKKAENGKREAKRNNHPKPSEE